MLDTLDPDTLLLLLRSVSVADVLNVASTCKALRRIASDDGFWRDLARRKWGARVAELKALLPEPGGSWRAYAARRMNLRPPRPPSPLCLVQERFPDPWQHIVCCVLCSRTSGSDVIRSAIERFFEALPTPTAVLDAADDALFALLHPLGLQPVRARAARSISHGFLATDWEDPSEFYGCGAFVADSWRIFCQGALPARVGDATLQRYLGWARAHERGKAAQGGGDSGGGGGGDDDIAAGDGADTVAAAADAAVGKDAAAAAEAAGARGARRAAREARAALAAGDRGAPSKRAAARRPQTRSSVGGGSGSGSGGLHTTRAGGTARVKGSAVPLAKKKGQPPANKRSGRAAAAKDTAGGGRLHSLRDQTTARAQMVK